MVSALLNAQQPPKGGLSMPGVSGMDLPLPQQLLAAALGMERRSQRLRVSPLMGPQLSRAGKAPVFLTSASLRPGTVPVPREGSTRVFGLFCFEF